MTIEEIKQAIANGQCVKYQNSHNTVCIGKGDIVYSQYAVTGTKKELTTEDLDDCFI